MPNKELYLAYIYNIILSLNTITGESNLLRKIESVAEGNAHRYQYKSVNAGKVYKILNSLEEFKQKEKESLNDAKDIQSVPSTDFSIGFTRINVETSQLSVTSKITTFAPNYYELGEEFPEISFVTDHPTSASTATGKRFANEIKYKEKQNIPGNDLTINDFTLLNSRLHEEINDKVPTYSLINKLKKSANLFEEYAKPPPWVKYEPMKLRDETTNLILLNNHLPEPLEGWTLPNQTNIDLFVFKYPYARKRWFWEHGEHHMHWLFWHCYHWMTFWDIYPPSTPTKIFSRLQYIKDNKEDLLNDLYYKNCTEAYFYKYCNWLLPKERRLKYLENSTDLTENELYIQSNPPQMKHSLRNSRMYFYEPDFTLAASCYYCNQNFQENDPPSTIEGLPQARICSRAFHDPFYTKFKYYMRTKCFNSRNHSASHEMLYGYFNDNDGFYEIAGWFFNKSCVTISTEMGELYTERTCRYSHREHGYKQGHHSLLGHVVDVLSAVSKKSEQGCWTTPYSTFVPLLRSKVGHFIRVTLCICKGDYCNPSFRLTHSNELIIYLLLLKLFLV